MNRFAAAMQPAHAAMKSIMGENFTVDGKEFEAIDIGEIKKGERVMAGGLYRPGSLTILVSAAVLAAAGLKLHALLTARDVPLRVAEIEDEGDGTHLLTCGPAGAKTPNLR